MRALGDYMSLKFHMCIGGTSVRDDQRKVEGGGIQVIVGTPGRVNDLIKRGALSKNNNFKNNLSKLNNNLIN
jgi:superfamily II DNA/RNA helicase